MPYCVRCERSFPHERALQQHKDNSNSHHICWDCRLDFPSSEGLEQHYIQSDNHHYCRSCEIHLSNREALLRHCTNNHYFCRTCDRFFSNSSNLEAHYRESSVHQASKRFHCDSCGTSYASEANLRSHLNSSTHRSPTVRCPGCKLSFISQSSMVSHLESGNCESGATRQIVNRRVREIDVNNIITDRLITYGEEADTVKYMATESAWNGYAYQCYFCPKTCRTLRDLNQHLASPRHESKTYICFMGDCKARFLTLSGLCQHIESEKCGALRSKVVKDIMSNISSGMKRLTL